MALVEITPDELLAGAALTFDVVIPKSILHPQGQSQNVEVNDSSLTVQLRPLTVGTFQLIMKAARNDAGLIPLLMIKESLAQPTLSLEQVKGMHLGLVNFLIAQIRHISGLGEKKMPLP
ncbi:hypothetical protein D0962_04630 [Leptolyngbyaceae cyanobacterium CCMR0082]|uniref:Uncharacterized protein n=1 Tax=Adonisia turfae CCMR0082 TaxID=2304604 RepID=A0A6M0S0T5_9CYAN|nr:hypothetical protein [Adonisia turfae CCMR0082]